MRTYVLCSTAVWACLSAGLLCAQNYKLKDKILIGGSGGWDYLTVDDEGNRLYVSHNSEVDVVDLKTNKPAGKIAGLTRVHGIALAEGMKLGFISDGGANQVVVFDIPSLQVKNKIKAGTNPDGIVYDPYTKRVFAFNGRSNDATVIDAGTGNVVGTIPLGGKPEFPTSDGKGNVYDNIESKNEIVQIDAKNMTVKAHWPIAPCESPSGMAIDTEHNRLFSVCDSKAMAVVDSETGKVVGTPEIGEHPDAAGYDPGTGFAFSSNGDGTLTVVKQHGGKYVVGQTVETEKGARTMTLDRHSHTVYLATADFEAAPAATSANSRPRPQMKPDTFRILIVSQ